MDLFNELKERGLIYQSSNEEAVKDFLNKKGNSFYLGFDPTAQSLHIGSLLPIIFIKRLETAGLRPVILVGGATGLIGDPSGKLQERSFVEFKTIKKNSYYLKKQLSKFFDFGSIFCKGKVLFVNNYEWLKNIYFIDFIRDIGKHFTISEMINKESVQKRMQTGISFTEFSYMIIQALDFLNLYKKYNCVLQVGGSDQWGNMTAGIELIRKKLSKEALVLTMPLATKEDGSKFGKTEEGNIWLDAELTSPYHFYQFWINVGDNDVIKFLKYYTFLSLDEIDGLKKVLASEPEKRESQKILAREMTEFVHGKEVLNRVEKISQMIFYGKIKELNNQELKEVFSGSDIKTTNKFNDMSIVDFLVSTEVVGSKRQAREDTQNKAIEINGLKIQNSDYVLSKKDLMFEKYILIKRGKRDYHFIVIK
ncbi:tyrosine--tRNA ligase [Patescibacteria group bacterium]|nr:tyrosine--tRNA ligase [Patescibacteria group bacterium]